VLVIDADPQGNTTSGLGLEKNEVENTVYNLMLGEKQIEDVIYDTCVNGLYIIPSNINLSGAEIELIGQERREYILDSALKDIKKNYDFILIDCPPSLNLITINALTASDTVLVPIQCEYFALEGLEQLMYTISLVKKRLNSRLSLEGVVFTMYDARTNLSMEVVEEVKQELKSNIYKTIIPRNVRLGEAPSHGLPITMYDNRSKGAESYRLLAEEVIEKEWN
jgi:chromosome partitioning protein